MNIRFRQIKKAKAKARKPIILCDGVKYLLQLQRNKYKEHKMIMGMLEHIEDGHTDKARVIELKREDIEKCVLCLKLGGENCDECNCSEWVKAFAIHEIEHNDDYDEYIVW